MSKFKSTIVRSGASDQYIYGNNLSSLIILAMKELHKPVISTKPLVAIIYIRHPDKTNARGNPVWVEVQRIKPDPAALIERK